MVFIVECTSSTECRRLGEGRQLALLTHLPKDQWCDVRIWFGPFAHRIRINPTYNIMCLKHSFLRTQPCSLVQCRFFSRPDDYTSEMDERTPLGDMRECWALLGNEHWGEQECRPLDMFDVLWDEQVIKNPECTIAEIMPYLYKHFGCFGKDHALVCMRHGTPVSLKAKWLDVKDGLIAVRMKRCHVALEEALPAPLGEPTAQCPPTAEEQKATQEHEAQVEEEQAEPEVGEQDKAEEPEEIEQPVDDTAMVDPDVDPDVDSDIDDCVISGFLHGAMPVKVEEQAEPDGIEEAEEQAESDEIEEVEEQVEQVEQNEEGTGAASSNKPKRQDTRVRGPGRKRQALNV